jgi:hypothetical protein
MELQFRGLGPRFSLRVCVKQLHMGTNNLRGFMYEFLSLLLVSQFHFDLGKNYLKLMVVILVFLTMQVANDINGWYTVIK